MANKRSRAAAAAPVRCPCGSGLAATACCLRFFPDGDAPFGAPTPEALMRSRFTAYATGRDDYVTGTWAAETRPAELFAPGEPRPKWLRLTVSSSSVSEDGKTGEVTFTALGRTNRGAFRMTEHSRFRREADGRWVYLDGDLEEEG